MEETQICLKDEKMENRTYSNYKRINRWKGIIDYKSLTFLISYIFIIFNFINMLSISFEIKFYIILVLTFPVGILLIVNVNNQSAVDALLVVIKYILKRKIYINTKLVDVKDVNKTCKIFSKVYKKV